MKVTIYLRGKVDEVPYRICYFAQPEYERLMQDYQSFIESGDPQQGLYIETFGPNSEYLVKLDYNFIAKIIPHNDSISI